MAKRQQKRKYSPAKKYSPRKASNRSKKPVKSKFTQKQLSAYVNAVRDLNDESE